MADKVVIDREGKSAGKHSKDAQRAEGWYIKGDKVYINPTQQDLFSEELSQTESNRGQEEITESDFEAIVDVVNSPDRRVFGLKKVRNNETFASIKKMPDGTIIVVEEVRVGRKKVALKTMRRHTDGVDTDAIIRTLRPNAQSDIGRAVDKSITETQAKSKEDEQNGKEIEVNNLTPRQKLVVDAVDKAVKTGNQHHSKINKFVAKELNVSDDVLQTQDKYGHSVFEYDVFEAKRRLENIKRAQTERDKQAQQHQADTEQAPDDGAFSFDNAPVIDGKALKLTQEDIAKSNTKIKALRTKAKELAMAFIGIRKNIASGFNIKVGINGIKHTITGAQDDLLSTLPYLGKIIEQSVYMHSAPDKKGNKAVKKHHYFGIRYRINGKVKNVVMDVREMNDGTYYYDHAFTKETANDGTHTGGDLLPLEPMTQSEVALADINNIPQTQAKSKEDEQIQAPDDGAFSLAKNIQPDPIERQAEVLQGEPVAEVNKADVPRTGITAVKTWAKNIFSSWGNRVFSPRLGEVSLSGNSVSDSLEHSKSLAKHAAFGAVKDVLENGVLVSSKTIGNEQHFHVSAPVNIVGKKGISEDIVTVLVKKNINSQRMYVHSVTSKEKLLKPHTRNGVETVPDTSGSGQRKKTSADIHNILHKALTLNNHAKEDEQIQADLKEKLPKEVADKVVIDREGKSAGKHSKDAQRAEGWYIKGDKVYINPDNIQPLYNDKGKQILSKSERIAFVAWHELGHRGVHANRFWTEFKDNLQKASSNPFVSQLAKSIQSSYAKDGVTLNELGAVEEALVEINAAVNSGKVEALKAKWGVSAPFNQQGIVPFYQRLAEILRQFVRHIAGKSKILSNTQLFELLDMIKRGASAPIEPSPKADTQFSQSPIKSTQANIKRGREAMHKALTEKTSVHRAMYRNDTGWIDFVWGDIGKVKPNGKTKGGKGLSHIIESRMRKDAMTYSDVTEMLTERVVDTLAKGQEVGRWNRGALEENIRIEHNGSRVALSKRKGSNAWVVTAFDLFENKDVGGEPRIGSVDTLGSTQSKPTPTRQGLGAPTNNEDASGKGNDNLAATDNSPTLARADTGASHRDNTKPRTDLTQDDDIQSSLPPTNAELESQIAETVEHYGGEKAYKKAKADGKTKLNYKQWIQVRTPEFKSWFGDWESDPQNASKVTDPDTGEPLVVYHGTNADFDTFDIDQPIRNGRGEGRGFYFTNETKIAKKYATSKGRVMPTFLNLKNPFRGFDALSKEDKSIYLDTKTNEEAYDNLGIDGFIVGGQYIVRTPNQIKSAIGNNGDFSSDNDDIRFSLNEDNDSEFAKAVDTVAKGVIDKGYTNLGTTPDVLILLGVPETNIRITGKIIEKSIAQQLPKTVFNHKNPHNLKVNDLKKLPKQLNDPIAVFNSDKKEDALIVLTELREADKRKKGEKPVIAALFIEKKKGGAEIADIASVHGRSLNQLRKAFSEHLRYVNKEKAHQFLKTVTLYPNGLVPIKSAGHSTLLSDFTSDDGLYKRNIKTENDLTQDDDVKFSLIGKQGAKNLDATEERTYRLDNLKVARNMEAANKDAKTIRLATGWERGADGKWRYEILDGKLKPDAIPKLEGEREEVLKLDTVLNHKELYKAYPELKNVVVHFLNKKTPQSGMMSKYFGVTFIDVNLNKTNDIKSTILHEIQHIIQDIEGFAKGSNPKYAYNYKEKLKKEKIEKYKRENRLRIKNSEYKVKSAVIELLKHTEPTVTADDILEFVTMQDYYMEAHQSSLILDTTRLKEVMPYFNRISDKYGDNEIPSKYKEEFLNKLLYVIDGDNKGKFRSVYKPLENQYKNDINNLKKDFDNADNVISSIEKKYNYNEIEAYHRLSGEVEARNVESRLGMNESERRNTLIRDTEDVARKEQIFLRDGGRADSLNEDNDSEFAKAVDAVAKGDKVKVRHINVGTTPKVFKLLGVADMNVTITPKVINKIIKNKHSINPNDLKKIPAQINNPVAISKSRTVENGYIVFTELTENVAGKGKPVIAAMHIKTSDNGIEVMNIASAYGRNEEPVKRDLKQVVYWNTKKGSQLANAFGLQLPPELRSLENLSNANIKTENDLTQDDDAQSSLPPTNAELESQIAETVERYGGEKAYKKAKADGKTKLNYKQWVQVRTPEFKSWFGDWKLAAKGKLIDNLSSIAVTGKPLNSEQAKQAYVGLHDGVNKTDGKKTRFVRSALGKITRHQGFDTTIIIPQLKEIFDSSVPIYSESEIEKQGHKKHSNFVGYHNYLNKINMDGQEYFVRMTLQELTPSHKRGQKVGDNQFHNTAISEIEIYKKSDPSVTTEDYSIGNDNRNRFMDKKLQQFFDDVKQAQANTSKVTDPDTGEPLVVYHGTNADFDTFDIDQPIRNGRGEGRGFYFTNETKIAKKYATSKGRIMPTFLNLKNPFRGFDALSKEDKSIYLDTKTNEEAYDNLGIDGFIVGGQYIVRTPNQIKSAIGNNGAFSSDNDDIRFSLNEDNDSEFAKAVDAVFEMPLGSKVDDDLILMGETPKIIEQAGVDKKEVRINKRKIMRIRKEHPEMSPELIKQIPQQLNKPVAVFKNTKRGSPANSYVVLTELKPKNDQPIIVAIHADISEKGLNFNKIASAYSKERYADYLLNMAKYSEVRYFNEEKTQQVTQWLQLPEEFLAELSANYNNYLSKNKDNEDDVMFSLAYIKRGREAMHKALTEKTSVHRAMYRNDTGWIDFVWGDIGKVKPNGKTKGGKGLSHIIESRMRKDAMTYDDVTEMLTERVVDTIAKGQVANSFELSNSQRIDIESNGNRVSLIKNKGSNSWVITSFDLFESKGVGGENEIGSVDTSNPTQSKPTLTRQGLGAPTNNEDASGKGNDNLATTDTDPTLPRVDTGASYRNNTKPRTELKQDNDIKFSLNEDNDSEFAKAVDIASHGQVVSGYIDVGTIPKVLQLVGMPDVKVTIKGETFKKVMGGKHNLTAETVAEAN